MAFVEIVETADGQFVVQQTGGEVLQAPVPFATRAEAEEWLMRHDSEADDGAIQRPGDGQGIR